MRSTNSFQVQSRCCLPKIETMHANNVENTFGLFFLMDNCKDNLLIVFFHFLSREQLNGKSNGSQKPRQAISAMLLSYVLFVRL